MSKLPLVEGILKYIEEENISFCMPGHKGGLGFLSTTEGQKLYDKFLMADVTEVDGADNLHHPEGIIKQALDLLSKLYGSKKSYFLVNGSTSGNLAMIFSTFKEGDKVIVERNCHRSIFNGIIMRKLKPVYINNEINSRYNAPMSIDMGHFLCLLKEHSDAKGIIVTYPNYYGICSDLSLIIEEAKKYGMKVLVDSAHGAHFGISSKLPENALKLGADMVVMSSHKTLASLTQTAYLHVGDGIDTEMVDFYVSSFLSTSPSYMLMCSMDYGRYFLEEYGKDAYEGLIERANRYRIKINELGDFHVLDEKDLEIKYNVRNKFPQIDLSRYVINVRRGLSGHKLYDYLKSKRLQCELSDASNVVLIFSVFNEERDFEALYGALKECDRTLLEEHYVPMQKTYIPEARLLPWQAVESSKEKVLISEALGRICGSAVVPYPPGVPILNLGEIIDETSIDMIKYYLENKITVLGVEKDMITVLKS